MANLKEEIQIAKKALLNHGIVAFPTETVMGLGVLYNDFDAYTNLNLVKRRPEDKPYTLMVKCKEDLNKYGVINEPTQRVVNAFMPGSITIIVPVRKDAVPSYVTHNGNKIGMRIPTNKEAIELQDFLKSIIRTKKWKPTDKQMYCLARASNRCVSIDDAKTLTKLYEELEKFRP